MIGRTFGKKKVQTTAEQGGNFGKITMRYDQIPLKSNHITDSIHKLMIKYCKDTDQIVIKYKLKTDQIRS